MTMAERVRNFKKLINLFFFNLFFFIPVLFNSCSSDLNPFKDYSSKVPISTVQTGGTGEGYLGKPQPGTYDRKFPNYQCQNTNASQSILTVDNTKAEVSKDDCVDATFPINFNDPSLNFTIYNPNYITFRGAVFEKRANAVPVLSEVTESFCRYNNNNTAVDAIIRIANGAFQEGKLVTANATTGAGINGGWSGVMSTFNDVERSDLNNSVVYTSAAQAFELTVNNLLPQKESYAGLLKFKINNQEYSYNVDCRMMNVKPTLWVDTVGLLAYYKLNESNATNGSQVVDYSGNNHHGFAGSGMAGGLTSTGKINGSLIFEPNNMDYVQVPYAPSFDVPVITVSAWLYMTRADIQWQNAVSRSEYDQGMNSNQFEHWDLGYGGSAGKSFFFGVRNYDAQMEGIDPTVRAPNLDDPADLNTWIHLVGTYDGNTTKLYRDGVLIGSYSFPPTSAIGFLNQKPSTINGNPICIGWPSNTDTKNCADIPIAWGNEGFPGKIDEVSVWSRVLTADEIKTIYKAQSNSNWVLK